MGDHLPLVPGDTGKGLMRWAGRKVIMKFLISPGSTSHPLALWEQQGAPKWHARATLRMDDLQRVLCRHRDLRRGLAKQ